MIMVFLIVKMDIKYIIYQTMTITTLTKVKSLRQACRKLAANLQHTI